MVTVELDNLSARLAHLVAVEGYGHGYGLAPGLTRSWSRTPVPSIAACRTTARLRALPRDDVERVLAMAAARGANVTPEVRVILEGATGEPPWPDPLGPGFPETPLGEDVGVNSRMAQWIRRIRYLVREERFAGDKVRALVFGEAARRLLRCVAPGPSGYLLDAALASEVPDERSAWLYLLRHRYATLLGDDAADETVIRKVADELQSYRGESAGLALEVVDRLIARGVLPAGFSAPAPSPALRDRRERE